MFSTPFPSTIDSHHLLLEIPNSNPFSQQSQSTPGASRRAWINQLCLQAFLPWFQEEIARDAKVYPDTAALPSFWELVNGTAISFDTSRLVLIPTLAIDGDELRVPQEWVDIPDWVADYYVAVEVNPDEDWVKILGYTTHKKLKSQGFYNSTDRTYSLEGTDLIEDINVLWVTRQTNPSEVLQTAIPPLAAIPQAQADNLLERLGNPDLKFPRLAVPFTLWGALLTQPNWQKKLYNLRQGLPAQWSISEWLQTRIPNLGQIWGWEKREFVMVAAGMRSTESVQGLSRQLVIADNTYELRIFSNGNHENQIWRFELRGTTPGSQIPAGFKLRLLTEDLQPFENNEDRAVNPVDMLYVEVILEPGEGLVWETEPVAEDYEPEILQF